MAGTVSDVGYKVKVSTIGPPKQTVNGLDENLDYVYVLPFVEAAYVVGLGYAAAVEDGVYGTCVIFDIEPVAHVFALAVDRQRLAVADVVDEQRYQLFRELVRAVVVGAVGHNGGHAVGVMEGAHKVVTAGLGGTVRRVRLVLEVLSEEVTAVCQVVRAAAGACGEGRLNALGVSHGQRSVDFIGTDVVEAARDAFAADRSVSMLELTLNSIRQRLAFPVEFGGLKQAEGAHDIGLCKGEGVPDASVHMAFGRKVDYAIDLILLHQRVEGVEVTDVHADEAVVGAVLNVPEVGQIAGIGQLVQIDDSVIRILVDEQPYHMAAYETGSTGNYNCSFEGDH